MKTWGEDYGGVAVGDYKDSLGLTIRGVETRFRQVAESPWWVCIPLIDISNGMVTDNCAWETDVRCRCGWKTRARDNDDSWMERARAHMSQCDAWKADA